MECCTNVSLYICAFSAKRFQIRVFVFRCIDRGPYQFLRAWEQGRGRFSVHGIGSGRGRFLFAGLIGKRFRFCHFVFPCRKRLFLIPIPFPFSTSTSTSTSNSTSTSGSASGPGASAPPAAWARAARGMGGGAGAHLKGWPRGLKGIAKGCLRVTGKLQASDRQSIKLATNSKFGCKILAT